MESRPPVIPGTACPPWCKQDHDGEPRHLAELLAVPLAADGRPPALLFGDVRQEPGDDRPRVHLDLDEMPLLQLSPEAAADLGAMLTELARLAIGGGDR